MSYYEMGLENQREYVYQNDFTVAENALGAWLIAFLDVDWDDLIKKTESLREDHEGTLSKFRWMQEKQRRQWELTYSERVVAWYHGLKETLSARHPLLKLLVEQQIRNQLVCASQPENRTELRMEVLRYLEVLDGTLAHSEQTVLSPMDLRPWLLEAEQIFFALQTCQEQLLPLLNQVMGGSPSKDGSILQRYYRLQQHDVSFQCMVEQRYRLLSPKFHITNTCKIVRPDLPEEDTRQADNLEGHTYMVTDALEALTLWEFEMICANEILLRRCSYCNRTQMAAQRRKGQYPDILRRYRQVQLRGKELLEQVEAGTMTFSQFQQQFDKKPGELLGIRYARN